jgi:hypothetical protein
MNPVWFQGLEFITTDVVHTRTSGYAAAHFIDSLRYNPEGRWFDRNGVIGIFHYLNPSGPTVALRSCQFLVEMSISCEVKVAGAWVLTTDPLEILGASTFWSPVEACNGIALPYLLVHVSCTADD